MQLDKYEILVLRVYIKACPPSVIQIKMISFLRVWREDETPYVEWFSPVNEQVTFTIPINKGIGCNPLDQILAHKQTPMNI